LEGNFSTDDLGHHELGEHLANQRAHCLRTRTHPCRALCLAQVLSMDDGKFRWELSS
jgi:hypothetical protein